MSKKIIAANWKINLDYNQSISLAKKISDILNIKNSKNEVIIFPDFTSLSPISEIVKDSQVKLGSQDISPFSPGPYTGEVDIKNIKQISCKYALVGHSERRQYFNDDKMISDKINNIIKVKGVTPVLCIGENLEEKKAGETKKIIKKQLKEAFSKIKESDIENKKIVIAYEPIWAIGSGVVARPSDLVKIHRDIKNIFKTMFSSDKVLEPKVLYGGSVSADNFVDFHDLKDIDGFLIGGASLKAGSFLDIAYNF
jgi:triosephosphate isomerase (TIM)